MGLHHSLDLFVGVIGIENVADAHSACRHIAEASRQAAKESSAPQRKEELERQLRQQRDPADEYGFEREFHGAFPFLDADSIRMPGPPLVLRLPPDVGLKVQRRRYTGLAQDSR